MIEGEQTSKGRDWDSATMRQPDLFQMSDVSYNPTEKLHIADVIDFSAVLVVHVEEIHLNLPKIGTPLCGQTQHRQ